MSDKEKIENEMNHALREGEMEKKDPERAALEQLSPKYEIRIKAEKDPIVEETRLFREMAEEVDDRYESYLSRIPEKQKEKLAENDKLDKPLEECDRKTKKSLR